MIWEIHVPHRHRDDSLVVDVHHADGYDDPFDLAGLEALCKRHHGELARAEQLQGRGL